VFAQHHPLSLAISITFEQSYNDIDGDAPSAELYAMPLRLSGIPIRAGHRQSRGSVNQKGRVQVIDGSQKVLKGSSRFCREKG